MKPCPACRGTELYGSHRRGFLERGPLTWIGIFPFRCSQCQARFYRLDRTDALRQGRGDVPSPADRARPPRWPLGVKATVTIQAIQGPNGSSATLEGTTENASLEELRLRLPQALPEGTRVSLAIAGAPPALARIRWSRPQADQTVLHGVQLETPFGLHTGPGRPLRRLRLRQLARRLAIGLIGLALIALGAAGIVWLSDALRGYNPQFYEPKDIERQEYLLRRLLDQMKELKRK